MSSSSSRTSVETPFPQLYSTHPSQQWPEIQEHLPQIQEATPKSLTAPKNISFRFDPLQLTPSVRYKPNEEEYEILMLLGKTVMDLRTEEARLLEGADGALKGVSIATFLIGFAISVEIACNKLLDSPHPYRFLIGCVHGWFHHYCTHYLSEGREALQANGTTCRLPQSLQEGFDDVSIGVPQETIPSSGVGSNPHHRPDLERGFARRTIALWHAALEQPL
ncbi:hypothetical protein RHGRI_031909 [Rhododendron griersonianum]|uniref:Uncharacterized protein n=1 Tax=Rhododendron griersonianum TaxID=479676 RepID=A0AAV6I9X2_9ERIC|nr:hypothetical protein RHGRI_031909 [Rhododendron griersonianum]